MVPYLSILQIYAQLPEILVLTFKVTEITKLLENQLIIYKNTQNSFRSMPENFKHTNRPKEPKSNLHFVKNLTNRPKSMKNMGYYK